MLWRAVAVVLLWVVSPVVSHDESAAWVQVLLNGGALDPVWHLKAHAVKNCTRGIFPAVPIRGGNFGALDLKAPILGYQGIMVGGLGLYAGRPSAELCLIQTGVAAGVVSPRVLVHAHDVWHTQRRKTNSCEIPYCSSDDNCQRYCPERPKCVREGGGPTRPGLCQAVADDDDSVGTTPRLKTTPQYGHDLATAWGGGRWLPVPPAVALANTRCPKYHRSRECPCGEEVPVAGPDTPPPSYAPAVDDDGCFQKDQMNNNCYNYGNDVVTDTFAQPGRGSGTKWTANTCDNIRAAAERDGLVWVGTEMPTEQPQQGHTVAMLIWPSTNFHWIRRDVNLTWSHKPGGSPVSNVDNDGKIIVNPKNSNFAPWTEFCGFFTSVPSNVTIN